jgi:hypothetical protein
MYALVDESRVERVFAGQGDPADFAQMSHPVDGNHDGDKGSRRGGNGESVRCLLQLAGQLYVRQLKKTILAP